MKGRVAAIWICTLMLITCITIIVDISEPVRGATTIYVDDSGGADYLTIQEGIDAANDGDTVFVYNGTYNENVVLSKTVSLIGEDRNSTLIDRMGNGANVLIIADWVNITGFTVSNSGAAGSDAGIDIDSASNVTVTYNNISHNDRGIYFTPNSRNNRIIGNIISYNDDEGLRLFSEGNEISDNIISYNNWAGFFCDGASGNTIKNNIIQANNYVGLLLGSSKENHVSGNIFIEDGIIITGNKVEHWNTHNIDLSNTVNGKPVIYWKNQTSGMVPSGGGQLILANCTNILVENVDYNHTSVGIELGFSLNNEITDSKIISNGMGIYLYNSDKNTFFNNNASYNDYNGFYFYESNDIILEDNNASGNNDFGFHLILSNNAAITNNSANFNSNVGIWMTDSNGNDLKNNTMNLNGDDGIHILSSNNNTISGNNVCHNGEYGFYLKGSFNNRLFHNNLINNTIQAFDDKTNNNWDNGYPSGGNYWSDYTGLDDFSGPDQDQLGSDGIGDTNYSIDSNSIDNYPLMEPTTIIDFDPPEILSGPDVTNITHDSASIEWITDEISDSTVRYGKTTIYGNLYYASVFTTNHKIDLTNLEPSIVYHFMVESEDPYGNKVTSGDYTFSTDPLPPPVHNIDKDTYYDTIQEAVDDADSGNTILVSEGTYYESVIIDKTLNLIGEDRNNTIINGSWEEDVVTITSNYVNINNFTVQGSGPNLVDSGIELFYVQDCNIENNKFVNNSNGIQINHSDNNVITNNYLINCSVSINSSIGIDLKENTFLKKGIMVGGENIEYWNSHEVDASNTVNEKPIYYWKNQNGGTLPLNSGQIILANCNNIVIENQDIRNTSAGILLGFSNNNIIRSNMISNNMYGLNFLSSNDNLISENTIEQNGYNLYFMGSNGNNIENNNIIDGAIGLILLISDNNVIDSNLISDNGNAIWLFASNNSLVNSNELVNNDIGLWLLFSKNNNLFDNNISNSEFGINLWASNRTTVSDNTISNNEWGIYLLASKYNDINSNTISENGNGTLLSIDSKLNNVTKNEIVDNGVGISLDLDCDSNNIINNTISENEEGLVLRGMYEEQPENNLIYHNSFIENTIHSVDNSDNKNQWDNGYPSGGNYWDDYSGQDLYNGPNQDIFGADGIGDSFYIIDSDSRDNYPLIKPYGVDIIPPEIKLISPGNYDVIKPGTIIALNITDSNLELVTYTMDDEVYEDLPPPYEIDTSSWEDGDRYIRVRAEDSADNVESALFSFIVDSVPPTISLESPEDGSFIGVSPEIVLDITDDHMGEIYYTINSQNKIRLFQPLIIHGEDWSEGQIILKVEAYDQAWNLKEETFQFTKDITPPEITLDSPSYGSLLGDFATIKFTVSDDHLDSVKRSINEGSFITINEPYDLETGDWEDGEYEITIKAEDKAGNIVERWFIFRKDTTPPSISSASIDEGEDDVDTEAKIIIEFDESMDTESVEDAISISPDEDYKCSWSNNNRTLTITCDEPFDYDTTYAISINTKAKDMANLNMEDKFELEFTTESEVKKDDEFPVLFLLLALLVVVIIVVLILFLVMSRKKKAPISGADPDLLSGMSQPPVQQYSGYQAQNTYPVQQPNVQISCPKCQYKFLVSKPQGPTRMQCPNCGTQGTLR
jgi:parallel beta-helix repeat protein